MSARNSSLVLLVCGMGMSGCQYVFGLDSFEEGAASGGSGGRQDVDASEGSGGIGRGGAGQDSGPGGKPSTGGTTDAGNGGTTSPEASTACVPDCEGNTPRMCVGVDGGRQLLSPCEKGTACFEGACVQPSCAGLLTNCGPSADESCCARRNLPDGNFNRSNDATAPAHVSPFALDRFEITVGRFRRFVTALEQGYQIQPGDGVHPRIPNTGWDATWTQPSGDIVQDLVCDPGGIYTWTSVPGDNENRPIDCIDWYEAFAFCAWDGGRLPTEAEWNYAAAGGDEQRFYPWSTMDAGGLSPDYLSYYCLGDGLSACAVTDLIFVGTKAAGASRWGHLDLAGNVFEWVFDAYQAPYPDSAPYADSAPSTCANCAALTGSERVYRGGDYVTDGVSLETAWRDGEAPTNRFKDVGMRCARAPDP